MNLPNINHSSMEISKWIISTRNKIKMALALIVVAGLLVVANHVEQEHVSDIDKSFFSIYADRLVPATTIFEIREYLYEKQALLSASLHTPCADIPAQRRGIDSCNQRIDQLLSDYKKTYFWEKEAGYLQLFEDELGQYNRIEAGILNSLGAGNGAAGRLQAQEQIAGNYFESALLNLSALNHIQSEIGKNMLSDSKKTMANFLLLSNLETALIVLFALIAHILIYASRAVIQRRVDTFHMN